MSVPRSAIGATVLAVAAAHLSAQTTDETTAAVDAQFERWLAAFEDRDAQTLAGIFTEDGTYAANTGQVLRGRADIRQGVARWLGAYPEMGLDVQRVQLRFRYSGEGAYDLSRFTIRAVGQDCIVDAGHALAAWRHGADGRWRLESLLVNQDPEPPADACVTLVAARVARILRISFAGAHALGLVAFSFLIVRSRVRSATLAGRFGSLPSPPELGSWLLPPVILLSGLGAVTTPWRPIWALGIWVLLRAMGVAVGLGALVVMAWAVRASRAPLAADPQGRGLVAAGPFRWVRHPASAAGAALWLGAAVGARRQARADEQALQGRFGDGYVEYAAATGRLMPRLSQSNPGAARRG